MRNCFHAGDILVPQHISLRQWACIACDQFSSQTEYWERVRETVGDAPSTFHMILPEALLRQGGQDDRMASIHSHMEQYLQAGFLRTFRRSFVYVERTMESGEKRRGLMGQIDLEEYDYDPASAAHIRATEGTVRERIPARMELLRGAKLEFPHVILLCDDRRDEILSAAREMAGETLYDFDLMEDGGHITGKLVTGMGVSVVNSAVSRYIAATEAGKAPEDCMTFAVGDGNHSLAAAKACWDELKPTLTPEEQQEHPARFALVELENIHDEANRFEPIHRVVKTDNTEAFLAALGALAVPEGHPLTVVTAQGEQQIFLSREESPLAVAVLQPFLDRYGADIDYIHGADVVRALSRQPGTVGLILPGMDKGDLFPGVLRGGVLPRKTFSMGRAREKRYYLEGKRRS